MEITAMEILVRCRKAPEEVAALEATHRRLLACAGRPGAVLPGEDRAEALSADINAAKAALVRRDRERIEEERVACKIIAFLPAIMGEVMYRYYVNGDTLEAVARASNYHPSHVRRMKARGDLIVKDIPVASIGRMLAPWYGAGTR